MKNNRVVIIAVAFTMVATFYSLSELHRMSTLHAATDTAKFATHEDSTSAIGGKAHTTTTQTTTTSTSGAGTAAGAGTTTSASTAVVSSPPPKVASSPPPAQTSNKKCYVYEHTELWGDVVAWGTQHSKKSAGECCDACKNHKPANPEDPDCNVWVFCGDKAACGGQYGQCWLKHLAHPEASKPAKQGPATPWTSGTIDVDINADPMKDKVAKKDGPRKFHIVTSAQGTAVHWQVRIHYYWLMKWKAVCEKQADCEMGGFTRLLHSGAADDLMDELPTMVVDPLPQSMVEHSWYIVLNRPYAFVQWTQKAQIPERYVLMSEPDHIYLRPMPNFMIGDAPAAFPFFYIEPAKPDHIKITQKFTGPISKKEMDKIAPIGNSPTFLTWDQMVKVMPRWMNVSIAIFKDQEANQAWGWVQEMYGFAIAAYLEGIQHVDLFLHMMAQPPWDSNMELAPGKPYYILHYTYGMDYKLTGEFTPGKFGEWRFDKRTYSSKPLPRHLGEPPKGMKNDLVRTLISSFNEAMDNIPCWDEYAESGKITPCNKKAGGVAAGGGGTAAATTAAATTTTTTAAASKAHRRRDV